MEKMTLGPTKRMALIGLAILVLDQFTKFILVKNLAFGGEKIIIDGF